MFQTTVAANYTEMCEQQNCFFFFVFFLLLCSAPGACSSHVLHITLFVQSEGKKKKRKSNVYKSTRCQLYCHASFSFTADKFLSGSITAVVRGFHVVLVVILMILVSCLFDPTLMRWFGCHCETYIYIYIYISGPPSYTVILWVCVSHTHTDTHLTCTRLWCRLEKKAFINKWAAPRRRDVFLLSLFHPPIHISVTCSSSWYMWGLQTLYCYLGGLRLLVYLFVFRTVWGTIQLNNGRYSNVAFAVHVLFSHSVQVDIRFLGSAIDYHLIFNFQFFA